MGVLAIGSPSGHPGYAHIAYGLARDGQTGCADLPEVFEVYRSPPAPILLDLDSPSVVDSLFHFFEHQVHSLLSGIVSESLASSGIYLFFHKSLF